MAEFRIMGDFVNIQTISITGSILFICIIIFMIRNRKLKEEYSLLWFFSSIIFLAISLWKGAIDVLARITEIDYPPAALFIVILASLFVIMIHFSVVISRLTKSNKTLTQEIGFLKLELENLKKGTARKQERKK
jgi:hypothetical protein